MAGKDKPITFDLLGKVEALEKKSKSKKSKEAISEQEKKKPVKKTSVNIRTPPKGDEQPDFFVPVFYDIGTKDSRSLMDVAVFRLSKKDKRAGEAIHYKLPDGYILVSSGPAGMASVWDYDIVLMAISHLTEAVNRYRSGKGEKPSRIFRPHISEILKFCRRSDGGRQKDELVEALLRLSTTHIAIERTKKINTKEVTISEGEALISRYQVVTNTKTGKPEQLEIELPNWVYQQVVESKNPDVLTVHPDFFLIDPGIGRFIYRLARLAAGRSQAKWAFQTLYKRSGSTGSFKKFSYNVRKLIETNDLPEYDLKEENGQIGPLLVMSFKENILGS